MLTEVFVYTPRLGERFVVRRRKTSGKWELWFPRGARWGGMTQAGERVFEARRSEGDKRLKVYKRLSSALRAVEKGGKRRMSEKTDNEVIAEWLGWEQEPCLMGSFYYAWRDRRGYPASLETLQTWAALESHCVPKLREAGYTWVAGPTDEYDGGFTDAAATECELYPIDKEADGQAFLKQAGCLAAAFAAALAAAIRAGALK